MKKTLIAIAAALASGVAMAGFKQPAPVVIDTDNMFAQGDMTSAAGSENEFEFIGCGTRTFSDGVNPTFEWGFCQAGLEEGASITCYTEDASLINAMRSAADYSFITFSWNEDLNCTRVGNSTQSFYLELPKKTDK